MSWEILNNAVNRYHKERERLKRIEEIVLLHPEWVKSEPELEQLLKQKQAA